MRRRLLKDKYNSIIFEKGKDREIYLVGGYVRDTLRGADSQDRDFVVSGDLISFVEEIRGIFGGTIVKFKKGDMIRLALKEGATFDFSAPLGSLAEDLSKRDFTINAIAWSPERGIVDIHKGIEDIEKKKIRLISERNLVSDPLRILRAYRFAAELSGSIENRTRETIKTLHNKIESVSPERITLELFHLLNSENSFKYLKSACNDGILADILLIPDGVLAGNVRAISKVEKVLIKKLPLNVKVLLDNTFSQNLTYKGLLCLELLLRGSIFACGKITISADIRKRIGLTHKGLVELRKRRPELRKRLFDVFMVSKGAALDVIIVADRLDLLRDYRRFRNIMRDGFLGAEDIIKISGITAGRSLGNIILNVKRAQFERRLKSKREAMLFIKEFVEKTFPETEDRK